MWGGPGGDGAILACMSLQVEIQQLMNQPVMNTDFAELTMSSGTTEGLDSGDLIRNVIFPMLNGIQAAVLRLAAEIDEGRGTT